MSNKIKEFISIITLIFLFSYLLNFVWESYHSVFLYIGHNFESLKYVPMIGYVSMIDGFLILGMYLGVFLLWRNPLWINGINKLQATVFVILGLVIAWWIEYKAVFLLQRWSYNSLMPTVFGIGLSPLVQLSITGLMAIFLTQRLLYQKGVYYGK